VGRAASAARVDALGGGGALDDAAVVVSRVTVERVMAIASAVEKAVEVASAVAVAIAVQSPQLFDNTPPPARCAG